MMREVRIAASLFLLLVLLTGALIGGGGVLGLTANSMIYAGAGGAVTSAGAPTNGQLLIGSTGAAPALATLTAGTGHTITNGAGSITIALTSPVAVATGGTGLTTAPTNGQLLVGSTGVGYALGTLTAGAGVSVTNGAASITVAALPYSTGTPTVGTCGTGPTLAAGSVDGYGAITVGTGTVTACTLTFSKTLSAVPVVTVSDNSTAVTIDVSAVSTTAVTFSTSATLGGGIIYYHAFGGS